MSPRARRKNRQRSRLTQSLQNRIGECFRLPGRRGGLTDVISAHYVGCGRCGLVVGCKEPLYSVDEATIVFPSGTRLLESV